MTITTPRPTHNFTARPASKIVPPAATWDGGALAGPRLSQAHVRTLTFRPGIDSASRRPSQARSKPPRLHRFSNAWRQFLVGGLFGCTVVVGVLIAGADDAGHADIAVSHSSPQFQSRGAH